jgi:hypothetical protein
MDISALKSRSIDIDKLVQAAQETNGNNDNKRQADERIWKPTVDKAGNGYAVIRFLPGPEGADLHWARYWDHGFKGPTGKWYIEKSLTSIGQQDPVSEANSKLWNSGNDDDKEIVRQRKRRLHYVTNILVLNDPSNPENNGKVFLYQFGKKIFDKIIDQMQPQFPDESPVNPFDLWSGADFTLKIANVAGYRNYDRSDFKSPSALFDGDEEKLQAVVNQLHTFEEWTDTKNYKSYDQLQTKLMEVLGESTSPANNPMASVESSPAPELASASQPSIPATAAEDDASEDEDDTMSYFQKLAQAE